MLGLGFTTQAQQRSCVVIDQPVMQEQPSEAPGPPPLGYECLNTQNVRVNVHFVQYDDGTGNFNANNDGRPVNPDYSVNGYEWAQGLIWAANGQMAQNAQLHIAPGSNINPLPAKRVQLVLTGVFFDRSTRYRGIYGTDYQQGGSGTAADYPDLSPLCVKGDSVINIFVQDELEWPYNGATRQDTTPVTHPVGPGRGYAKLIGNCNNGGSVTSPLYLSIASPWSGFMQNRNQGAWQAASLLNHEVCHLLGLDHTWYGNSGCADAPANNNCWNLNEPAGPNCDAMSKVSNNLMDYNAFQSSLSPCQIGTIQGNLNSCMRRYVMRCADCLPTYCSFSLPPTTCGALTAYVDGRATWNNHWYRLEIDQVDANNVVIPQTHYQHDYYERLTIRRLNGNGFAFSANTRYRVKITAFNYCGAASVGVKYITTALTTDCYPSQPGGGGNKTALLPASATFTSNPR